MWGDIWSTILEGDFLLAFFQLIMAVLVTIVNLLLYPIGLIISGLMPSLDQGLIQIANFLDYASTDVAWILNSMAIPGLAISIAVAYYMFSFSATFTVWTVKLIIRWKQALWA